MNEKHWARIKMLFAEAMARPAEDRAAFLAESCGEDHELRQYVEKLLSPDEETTPGILDVGASVEMVHAALRGGLHEVGPFRILETLGHGGMGRVYLAEQSEPVQRRVALKLIKLGMDTEEVLARFAAERRALAMMEHDNIAKVFDVGATESGQPYFVMEYVPGTPVTDYCDENALDIRRRLELFARICAGVQHAHQKGVIHRDLKPSNILVAEQDGRAVPKIIDFGIAKATDQRSNETPQFTREGEVIGTPDYMSPEQAGTESSDVDTRSDVYSLGVILYELLTGSLPFETRTREQGPARPSTTAGSRGAVSEQTARARGTTPVGLLRDLRGDLDWILIKALDSDRDRRYETPMRLVADLRRHVANEPVEARPPSTTYKIRKFVRRYRLQVVAASAVLLTLLAGIVSTTSFMIEAEANLDNYNLLANVVRLAEARAVFTGGDSLYPAWPEKLDGMREWLADHAEPLERALPELSVVLAGLRARALLPTTAESERSRSEHPRAPELAELRRKLAALERANAVREGRAEVQKHEFRGPVPQEAGGLNLLAWPLISWQGDREWGREAEGLALAERAWELVAPSEASADVAQRSQLARVADTLAWALFANGLDERAIAMGERAYASWPDAERGQHAEQLEALRKHVADASGDSGRKAIAGVEREVASLTAAVAARRGWRFAEPSEQFLHDALADLVADLRRFVAPDKGEIARVRERLAWASSVHERTISRHAVAWEKARRAIAKADGRSAHELYAVSPIDLRPQVGLVPIGMNPVTRLWEFYHPRSAANPDAIPTHDATGVIAMGEATGIVFVLIPGGTFLMGAQKDDSTQPNYDTDAQPHEMLLGVAVEPFFLARHEMTQAQWKRLSGGDEPSSYPPGVWKRDDDRAGVGTMAHPVETVSWRQCRELLIQHGLDLPGDADWEYACRATTTTRWSTGNDVSSLQGFANILDKIGGRAVPQWGRHEELDDGYIIHAPVGTFLPNLFGLFDMHGNVWEWCLPERIIVAEHPVRGGCFTCAASKARSALQFNSTPDARRSTIGVRAARTIRD